MYSPRLVFLSATRQDQERVQGLRWRLGLKNCLALKGEGSGGGVALIWDETLSVHLLSMSCRYIDVLISEANSGFQWRGTFVYGGTKDAGPPPYVGANPPNCTDFQCSLVGDG